LLVKVQSHKTKFVVIRIFYSSVLQTKAKNSTVIFSIKVSGDRPVMVNADIVRPPEDPTLVFLRISLHFASGETLGGAVLALSGTSQ
jgi:hypothetical protein